MANSDLTIRITAADMASGVLRGITAPLEGIGRAATGSVGGVMRLGEGLAKLGLGVFGIKQLGEAVGGLASSMVSGNAEFERYQTQFGVLLGSSEAAKKRLEEMADFGAKTPFELPEVVRADKILQGFGLHAEEAAQKFGFSGKEIRTIAGDVAAGAGVSFEEMAGYIGKFSSGATGEAIARFQELGILTRDQLRKMGLEFSKSGELLSPLPQATETVLRLMKEKYGGMMDAQSSTFEGMMSNLSDWMGQTKRKLMAPVFEVLKDKLGGVLAFLGSPAVSAAIDAFANRLAGGIAGTMRLVGNVISAVQPVITYVGRAFQYAGDNAQLAEYWLGRIPVVGGAVAAVFHAINAVAKPLGEGIGFVRTVVTDLVKGHLGMVAYEFRRAFGVDIQPFIAGIKGLSGPLGELANIIKGNFASAGEAVKKVLSGDIVGGITQMFGTVTGVRSQLAETLAGWAAAFIDWVAPMIPPLLAELGKLANRALDWIIGQVPEYIAKMERWAEALIGWVQPKIVPLVDELTKLASAVLAWIVAKVPEVAAKLGVWAREFIAWVMPLIPPLLADLLKVLEKIMDWVSAEAPGLTQKLIGEWIPAFLIWVGQTAIDIIPKLLGLLWTITGWIVGTAVPRLIEFAIKMGAAIVTGMVSGLANLAAEVAKAIYNAVREISIPLPSFRIDWNDIQTPFGTIRMPSIGIGVDWHSLKEWLPEFQFGGVVPGPLGRPTLAIVHGGEEVVPAGQRGRGGNTYNYSLTVNTVAPVSTVVQDFSLLRALAGA